MPPRPTTARALNDTTVIIEAKLTGNASINSHGQIKGLSDESIYQIKDSGTVLLLRTDMPWSCQRTFSLQIDVDSGPQPFVEVAFSIQAIIDDPVSSQQNAPRYERAFVILKQRLRAQRHSVQSHHSQHWKHFFRKNSDYYDSSNESI
jgi:hypothetical protein